MQKKTLSYTDVRVIGIIGYLKASGRDTFHLMKIFLEAMMNKVIFTITVCPWLSDSFWECTIGNALQVCLGHSCQYKTVGYYQKQRKDSHWL